MKKIYNLFFAVALFSSASVSAVTYTVQVADFSFTPPTITNVNVGDIIKFTWVSGTHTTTSVTVPSGAASWNQNINSGSTTFNYTVTQPGTYAYVCTFHSTSMGGGFVVNGTGIQQMNLNVATIVYPNPCKDKFTISYANNVDAVTLYNVMGEEIKTVELSPIDSKKDIDISNLTAGVYFYSTTKDGLLVETRRIVKAN